MSLQQQRLKRQLLKQYKRDEIKEFYKVQKASVHKQKKKEQMEIKEKAAQMKKKTELYYEEKMEYLKIKFDRQMEQLDLECRNKLQHVNSQRSNDDDDKLPDWVFSEDFTEDDNASDFAF